MIRLLLAFFIFLFVMYLPVQAQQIAEEQVVIDSIIIEGAEKTKTYILFRELSVQVGDSIPVSQVMEKVEENLKRLLNTQLFSEVEGNIKKWTKDNRLTLHFQVWEQYYLSGYPIFDLADRNFNVWWEEQNKSLKRINYGFKASHSNISGRADELKLGLTLGFTRKIDLQYQNPGINKKRTIGVQGKVFYAQNRETNFTTEENKFIFYRSEDFLLERFRLETRWTFRPKLDYYYFLDLGYFQSKTIDDIAVDRNPDFFLEGKDHQEYFLVGLSFIADKRREKPYTKQGWYGRIHISQSGIGIFGDRNVTRLRTTLAKYISFSPKWSLELFNRNQIFLGENKQAYFNNRALGSRADFLVGYELYAIDGTGFAYLKSSLRRQILSSMINIKRVKWLYKRKMLPAPIQVYLVANADAGYVNELHYQDGNDLANQGLFGWGIGVDCVLFYDKIIQIQYSFNHLNENGLFLHFKHKF
ncbi:MAG: BamA/TamA family outer membrane protein [Saprospiraceae bacterium]|nr:BamA/TamA family outer membrane protein [Saprospiraceae bacterium]